MVEKLLIRLVTFFNGLHGFGFIAGSGSTKRIGLARLLVDFEWLVAVQSPVAVCSLFGNSQLSSNRRFCKIKV